MRAGRLALNAAPRPERRRRFKWLLLAGGVMAAVGVAVRKSRQGAQDEMAKLTGGLNIPGLGDLLGGADSPE